MAVYHLIDGLNSPQAPPLHLDQRYLLFLVAVVLQLVGFE